MKRLVLSTVIAIAAIVTFLSLGMLGASWLTNRNLTAANQQMKGAISESAQTAAGAVKETAEIAQETARAVQAAKDIENE